MMNKYSPYNIYKTFQEKPQFLLLLATLFFYYLISQVFIKQSHFLDDLLYDSWARTISPSGLLFPHHPAFHLLQFCLWKILNLFLPSLTPFQVVQQMNLLIGSASGFLVFLIVWVGERKFYAAYSAMFLFILPFTSWFFFMGGEPYTIGIFFSLLLYYYLLVIIPKREYLRDYIFLGLLSAIMILLHNLTICAFLAAVSYLLVRVIRKKSRLSWLLFMVGTTWVLVTLFYLSAAALLGKLSSATELWQWLTLYGQTGKFGSLTLLSIPSSLIGLGRALHFGSYIRNFVFFGVFTWFTPIFLALFLIVVLCAIYLTVQVVQWLAKLKHWKNDEKLFLLVSVLVLSIILNILWQPTDPDFWEFALAPFVILSGLMLANLKSRWRLWLIYGLAVVLFLINFSGEIYPHSRFAEHPPDRVGFAQTLLKMGVENRDVVLTGVIYIGEEVLYQSNFQILPDYLYLDTLISDQSSWEENIPYIEEHFQRTWIEGGQVFVTEDLISQYNLNSVLYFTIRKSSYHVEPFLLEYGPFLKDTGYSFWLYGKDTKIFKLDLDRYYTGDG